MHVQQCGTTAQQQGVEGIRPLAGVKVCMKHLEAKAPSGCILCTAASISLGESVARPVTAYLAVPRVVACRSCTGSGPAPCSTMAAMLAAAMPALLSSCMMGTSWNALCATTPVSLCFKATSWTMPAGAETPVPDSAS